jgi:hypothetical protein
LICNALRAMSNDLAEVHRQSARYTRSVAVVENETISGYFYTITNNVSAVHANGWRLANTVLVVTLVLAIAVAFLSAAPRPIRIASIFGTVAVLAWPLLFGPIS